MLDLDLVSHLVTCNTDISISEIEAELEFKGFTTGYFYPPNNQVLLEQVLASKLPNLYATKYGEIPELCATLKSQSSDKTVFEPRLVPRQATGPNWKNLILGSERRLGIIYEATLKIFPKPEEVFFSIFEVDSLPAVYRLEQKLKNEEFIPRLFGRFETALLRSPELSFKKSHLLVLEWAENSKLLAACFKAIEQFSLRHHYLHRWIDQMALHSKLYSLLREALPHPLWSGAAFTPVREDVQGFTRQWLEALSGH